MDQEIEVSAGQATIACPKCTMQMVPRIVMGPPTIRSATNWQPVPKYSMCPFCGETFQKFDHNRKSSLRTLAVIGMILGVGLLGLSVLGKSRTGAEKPAEVAKVVEEAKPVRLSDLPWTGLTIKARSPEKNYVAAGLEVGYANFGTLRLGFPELKVLGDDSIVPNVKGYKAETQKIKDTTYPEVEYYFDANGTLIGVYREVEASLKEVFEYYANQTDGARVISQSIDEKRGSGEAEVEKGDTLVTLNSTGKGMVEIFVMTKGFYRKLGDTAEELAKQKDKK